MGDKKIFITETDLERLEAVFKSGLYPTESESLEDELSQAIVVKSEEVPCNVITMNTRVRFCEVETKNEFEITIVYPDSADVYKKRISVLTPIGKALLGVSVGDEVEWPTLSGKKRKLKVESVLFQPEAAGRYDL